MHERRDSSTGPSARGRWAAVVAALAAAAALAAPVAATAQADPAPGEPVRERAARTTELTISAPTCEGCRLQLSQYRLDRPAAQRGWSSRPAKVKDGVVTFSVPTRRTRGLTVTLRAPWEGHTGYVAVATVAYRGAEPGESVTLEDAVTYQRASACWAGTRRSALTLTLEAHEVEVMGVKERVPGTIAWFVPTLESWGPRRSIVDGVFGTQDVIACRKPRA